MRIRFFIRRKSGYMSPYSPSMLYGAAVIAPTVYDRPYVPVFIGFNQFGRLVKIPKPLLIVFRPFNRYRPDRKAHHGQP